MKRDLGRIAARASWCHARARVADLLDERYTEFEAGVASALRYVTLEVIPPGIDGDELARVLVLRLARRHAMRGAA